jgi:hypothetical protein
MILLIARRADNDASYGATKLNKLLFLADFSAYRRFGRSISGARCQKLEHGPAPRELLPVRARMIEDGQAVELTRDYFGNIQRRLTPLVEPALTALSGEEVALLEEVIRAYQNANATDTSEISHQFAGWKYALAGEDIPYETALLVERPSTPEDVIEGERLNHRYAWTVARAKQNMELSSTFRGTSSI